MSLKKKEGEGKFRRAGAEVERETQWLIADGLAWAQYYRKQYDGAERAFRQIVAGTPEAYLSQKGLGFVALERGDWAGAVKALTASLTRNPYQVLTSYTLPAKRLLEAKQYGEAKELLGLGERVYPYAADVRWLLAKALLGLKDEAGAAQKALVAVQLAPAYIQPVFDELKLPAGAVREAYQVLGWGLYYAGNAAAAKGRFAQYFAAGGDAAWARIGLGWAQLGGGETKEAEGSFRKALEATDNADAHAGLGWAQLGQDKVKEAEGSFRTALERSAGYATAQRGLGAIKYRQTAVVKEGWGHYFKGEYEAALRACDGKREEARKQGNAAAEDCRGWALLGLGRGKEAGGAFRAALQIDKDFFYAQSGLIAAQQAGLGLYGQAWALLEAGRGGEAEGMFWRAGGEGGRGAQWAVRDGRAGGA